MIIKGIPTWAENYLLYWATDTITSEQQREIIMYLRKLNGQGITLLHLVDGSEHVCADPAFGNGPTETRDWEAKQTEMTHEG